MLEINDIHTWYGDSYVLQGVNMEVKDGTVVALLGRNGMGKTTTIRSIIGLTPPRKGSITFNGTELVGMPPNQIARTGIGLVPQGRMIFPSLSVDGEPHDGGPHGRQEGPVDAGEGVRDLPARSRSAPRTRATS